MDPKTCSFSALPYDSEGPPYNAWGLYGPDDELGRLNLITPQAIRRGRDEIKEGIAISLNMPMGMRAWTKHRDTFEHEIIYRGHGNDDHVAFNTQCSSQWDGFRHWPFQNFPRQGEHRFYGGMTMDDARDKSCVRNGTQSTPAVQQVSCLIRYRAEPPCRVDYVKRPITSRAHLLDIPLFISRNPSYGPFNPLRGENPISTTLLDLCAEAERVVFEPGDICIVRTGLTEAFLALSEEEYAEMLSKPRESAGVQQGEDMYRWHWEKGIAAVASDTIGYESLPHQTEPSCHDVFLGAWGMPIGELFDLRELSRQCEKIGRWSFFFTSMPLLVEGGIASPPNAQAIL
ncbi:hypothetical protein JCM24511_00028 [Saitozyma sp. JCM 24511]|nr:hypothetical protein JCM24511_00028 [Saitozyma sp. JCM 24511]